jgi:hypothetical protein
VKISLQRAAALACAALLALAAYRSILLARADILSRQPSPDALAAALRLTPGNAQYWRRWADLVDETGQSPGDAYDRAAALDPYDSSLLTLTGLRAEAAHDFPRAERELLQAARVDRLFDPRWTLANFYFRRSDATHFWPWASSALAWAYGDRRPLYDLCWSMTSDAVFLLRNVIPDTPAVRGDYLAYLLDRNRLDAAEAVAASLDAAPSGADLLLSYTNRMLEAQRWGAALTVWNRLCQRGIVAYGALDPAHGQSLTNGDFRFDPLAAGFDWRLADIDGITSFRSVSPPALRLTFSGKQPERCDVLRQSLPVLPGTRYRLTFDYRAPSNEAQTGLQWRLLDPATGAALPALSPPLSGPYWQTSDVSFTVPPNLHGLLLVLAYRRVPGTVRLEGECWLRNLCLEMLP